MKSIFLVTIFLSIGFFGCSDQGTSPIENQLPTRYPPSYSFNYSAFDQQGIVSATGTLNLAIDNSRVTGSWTFDDGRHGTLAGTSDNGTLQIDLYPSYQDHNLVLTGTFAGSTFSGDWVMYGWSILGRGSFIAKVKFVVIYD